MIDAAGARILVDAGLSARQLCQRLAKLGIDPASLDGILLSHEHSDHARGIDVLLRKYDIPVYATAMTKEVLLDRCGEHVEWRIFQRGQEFKIREMAVNSFAVPHDAVDPVGFVCASKRGERIGVATDLGHVTSLVRESLRGVNGLFVEANYDEQMLENDLKRPWSVKQRISSRHGHLSNSQTAELVRSLIDDGLKSVILGHLSSDCNTAEVASRVVNEVHGGRLSLEVSSQKDPSGWMSVAKPRALAAGSTASEQGVLF